MPGRRPSKSGQATKEKILDAALATVLAEGLVGTSARAIAATGNFNQALVFYHFGSVEDLLFAALERANERRMARFAPQLAEVDDLPGLVALAERLHRDDTDLDQAALSAIVAGWSATSDIGPAVLAALEPWNEHVGDALRRIFARHPVGQLLPVDDLAHLIAALFLGIEVFDRLDGEAARSRRLFASMAGLARFVDPLLTSLGGDPIAAGPVAAEAAVQGSAGT